MLLKTFVELVYGVTGGFCADVQKHANVGLNKWAKGIEKPTMRIEFFLILPIRWSVQVWHTVDLLFEAEQDLNRGRTKANLSGF